MGLRGEQRPPGLACVLFDSPRDGAERVTALDAQRLASDLQAAVEYVFHGGAGAAAADSGPPQMVSDGVIDYDAVARHVQRAVHAAAGLAPPLPAGQEEPASPEGQQPGSLQGAEQANSTDQASQGSDGSAGSDQLPDEVPPLAAPDGSGSEAASPVAAPRAAAAPGLARSSGRLGPAEVGLVEARGTCDIVGTHVTSRSNFATVRSNACVFRGRWQYEVQLGSAGIMQLGWTTLAARFNTEEGVGDNHDSYAYDGRRRMRWHATNSGYGEHWVAGDVIGCCLDLDAGTMRFYRNGKDLGEAFANVRRGMPGMAYFAGVSLSYAERCEVNFGGRPLLFPVEGYQPLQHQIPDRYQHLSAAALGEAEQLEQQLEQQQQQQAAPGAIHLSRQHQVAVARYLAGCMSRLMDVSAPAGAVGRVGGTEGAPGAGSGGSPIEWAAGDAAAGGGGLTGEQGFLLPAAGGPLPSAASQLPDPDLLAALAAATGEPSGSKPAAPAVDAAAAAPAHPAGGHGGHGAGPAIRIDDRVLLGAVLAQHLGPLCFDPYCVEAVLLPLLDDTAGELAGGGTNISGKDSEAGSCCGNDAAEGVDEAGGAGAGTGAAVPANGAAENEDGGDVPELGRQRLAQLLDLLAAVLEAEELASLATHCCQVLGRRVRGCRWDLADLPRSDALGALRLWSAMLECQAIREAWLAASEWHAQLEQLVCVRQPSEEDLAQLFRNLKVVWSEGGAGVVRSRSEDDSALLADLNRIATGLDQLEAAQADLLLQLWLEPSRGTVDSRSICEGDSSSTTRTDGAGNNGQAAVSNTSSADPAQEVPAAADEAASAVPNAAAAAAAADVAGQEERPAAQPALVESGSAEAGGSEASSAALAAGTHAALEGAAGAVRPPAPAPRPPRSPRRRQLAAQQAGHPRQGHHLRQWLQHLVDRNHGATRHIPPPGLTDQTALVSAVFGLLRLMNEQLSASSLNPAAASPPTVPSLHWDPAITFLTGGALGGGDDPYWDAGRLGGTLSHLSREHPPSDEDRQPLQGMPIGAVVKYDAALRLAARAIEGPSFTDVWLRDRLLMLCHLSAAPLMRGGLSHLASMQAAIAGLRAVSAEGGGRMMEETRRQCQQEFVRSRRAHEWAQCWLLSPWHQQAAFVLSVDTAQLLQAVSEQRRGLLRYVPELYVSATLDMVHAVHRFEPAVLDHAAMLGLGLRHVIKFVVCHLEDERIVSPEVQSRLLNMVLDGVQELDLLRELGDDPVSRSRLIPAMMRLFGRPQLWGPVSNFFALLVEGNGFLHPPPAFPAEFAEPLGKLRCLFKEACLADGDLCERFTHHLFDNANRMLTELVASLEGMESSWTRGAGPSPQLLRLLSSTADYALVLLRVVELMAAEMPQLFLGRSDMNLTRLAEVVGFAVPQFVSGRAHRALQRVAANRVAEHLRLREAHLLQPLAGALVTLWEAEHAERDQQDAQQAEPAGRQAAAAAVGVELPSRQAQAAPQRRLSLAAVLDRQAALTDDILKGLLEVELSQVEPLSAEAAAAAAEAAADGGESPTEQRCRQAEDLRRLREVVDGLLRHRADAAAAGGRGGGGGGERLAAQADDLADAPEEFLDPILHTLMQDPVLLPDSHITVDRATIERHLLSSPTDPFSRAALSKDQLTPNLELLQQIQDWLQQLEQGGGKRSGSEEGGSGLVLSGTSGAEPGTDGSSG